MPSSNAIEAREKEDKDRSEEDVKEVNNFSDNGKGIEEDTSHMKTRIPEEDTGNRVRNPSGGKKWRTDTLDEDRSVSYIANEFVEDEPLTKSKVKSNVLLAKAYKNTGLASSLSMVKEASANVGERIIARSRTWSTTQRC